MSLNPHYFRAMNKIHKSIIDVRAINSSDRDRDESFIFMNGYILALADSELINSDECLSLRDELLRAFSGIALRRSIENGNEEMSKVD